MQIHLFASCNFPNNARSTVSLSGYFETTQHLSNKCSWKVPVLEPECSTLHYFSQISLFVTASHRHIVVAEICGQKSTFIRDFTFEKDFFDQVSPCFDNAILLVRTSEEIKRKRSWRIRGQPAPSTSKEKRTLRSFICFQPNKPNPRQ